MTLRRYERLATHPISASLARAYVRRMVIEWGRRDLVECAELVVGELVSNAIRATIDALPVRRGGDSAHKGVVGVGVYQVPGGVVVEVWDCSRQPPQLVEPAADDIGGRGLVLVDGLAKQWGYRRPVKGGKVVYAMIEAGL